MNHTHQHHCKIRGRNRTLLLGLILSLGIGVPLGTAASGGKGDRKPILPHVGLLNIDNEGPVTRHAGNPRIPTDRHRRDAILNWRGPFRLDLILPIRLMPDNPPARR
ncbi:MAG: hypothetical protein CMJ67_07565 [Planctomycetaceae bacterium]|nr:hypothetical protein [Planctomycetaceae bacterium]